MGASFNSIHGGCVNFGEHPFDEYLLAGKAVKVRPLCSELKSTFRIPSEFSWLVYWPLPDAEGLTEEIWSRYVAKTPELMGDEEFNSYGFVKVE